jgi:hypothetical protein
LKKYGRLLKQENLRLAFEALQVENLNKPDNRISKKSGEDPLCSKIAATVISPQIWSEDN